MARENTKYMSVNLRKDQHARLMKLAEKVALTPNSLLRLVAEKMQPSDVETMLKR